MERSASHASMGPRMPPTRVRHCSICCSSSRSRVATWPSTMSLWPVMDLVSEATAKSAPSASVRWPSGVAVVLSTATSAPARCARSQSAAMSQISISGVAGRLDPEQARAFEQLALARRRRWAPGGRRLPSWRSSPASARARRSRRWSAARPRRPAAARPRRPRRRPPCRRRRPGRWRGSSCLRRVAGGETPDSIWPMARSSAVHVGLLRARVAVGRVVGVARRVEGRGEDRAGMQRLAGTARVRVERTDLGRIMHGHRLNPNAFRRSVPSRRA